MRRIHRSALLPYAAARLFELVDAVELYPEFVPGCRRVSVHHRDAESVSATLHVERAGVSVAITTRNRRQPPSQLTLELVTGPLTAFAAEWRFIDLGAAGCEVVLDATFEVRKGLAGAAAGLLVERTANRLVDVFCERARQQFA